MTLLEVVRCMQRLNVLARDAESADRRMIYTFKTALIATLYRQGYCAAVVKEVRHGPCHYRGGCEICRYTGRHAYSLYRFSFEVEGERFIWHQPERHVYWPIELTADVPRDWYQPEKVLIDPAELPQLLKNMARWFENGGGVLTDHG